VSNAHAQQYYFGPGTETTQGSGSIDTYDVSQTAPEAMTTEPGTYQTPQPGLNAPIAQDKRRGSS